MHKELEQLKTDVTRWASDGQAQALVSDTLLHDAEKFNAETPASLFDQPERPLVVGFLVAPVWARVHCSIVLPEKTLPALVLKDQPQGR